VADWRFGDVQVPDGGDGRLAQRYSWLSTRSMICAEAILWSDIEAKLLRIQRAIVDQLDETKSLARGLTRREATDVMWTLNHPTVWHLLVRERRWSPQRYETWLHDAFCLHLLGPPAAMPDDADEHSTR
jgi:hypothetical protein